ncbi:helix-turn-helix domain-containing protein [Desulfoscipio gibsoniae]|uniref:Putative transcriptional regulator n=1 Tax=Desulfoscipio gibsoniae DSM 7213 TaxID=767817 RepID=R4KJ48_9FIRM|nr:helix-turn-helix transcriptional regulator [Desulfoscipio gibsoniae]AGK99660.1 putative transcriptional regulator [Desulfoscipio gibsoniae DSM 7213]
MIKVHLSKILGAKRINMTEIAQQTGLSRNTVFLLYHEKTERMDFSTLNKLCAALNCQPGDLLEHIPDKEGGATANE